MGEGKDLEPAGEAFGKALLQRAQYDPLEGKALEGVLVPEALQGLRPAQHLLGLVQDQEGLPSLDPAVG